MPERASRPVDPKRLAGVLALFLVPGAAAAVLLWHEVVNPVLAGRPPAASVPVVVASGLILAGAVAALAVYLRRMVRGAAE